MAEVTSSSDCAGGTVSALEQEDEFVLEHRKL